MIIDHRTYNMTHGKMNDYLERYEGIGLPLQIEHLGHLVGFFVCAGHLSAEYFGAEPAIGPYHLHDRRERQRR